LNLNISASIKAKYQNLVGIFGGIDVQVMNANFQASSITGVWGGGDRHTQDIMLDPYKKFLNSSLASLGMDKQML